MTINRLTKNVKMSNKNKFIYIIAIVLLVLCLPAFVCAEGSGAEQKNATPIWAAGNDQGVYFVLAREVRDQQGFQIFYRPKIASRFIPGNWYTGSPTNILMVDSRMLIFLAQGGCQSYDLISTRTAPRLPAGASIIDSAVWKDKLYVLAAKEESFELLFRGRDNIWHNFCEAPLPISDGDRANLKIGVLDDVVYLFGTREGRLWHCQLRQDQFAEPQLLAIENVSSMTVLTVNRQIKLMISVETDNNSTDLQVNQRVHQFQIVQQSNDGWRLGAPLKKDPQSLLLALPQDVCFATYGQNIAAFEYHSDKVLVGQYMPTGELFASIDQPITAAQQKASPILQWLLKGEIMTIIIIIAGILIFRYRNDAFGQVPPLPGYVTPAPFLRRLSAFIFDAIIISIFSDFVFSVVYGQIPPESQQAILSLESFSGQLEQGTLPPHLMNLITVMLLTYLVVFLLYFTLCESMFFMTPGKMIMNLIILDKEGNKPTVTQTIIRNFLRIVDFYPILLITRRRQRIGDLTAKTIVALKTPQLIEHLKAPSATSDDNSFDKQA